MKRTVAIICLYLFCFSQSAHAGLLDSLAEGLSKAFDNSARRLELYKAVSDKYMVDAFYVLSPDGKEEQLVPELNGINHGDRSDMRLRVSSLARHAVVLQFVEYHSGAGLGDVSNYYGYYASSTGDAMVGRFRAPYFETTDDEVGKRYIATAHARGSVVKLYKPEMSAIIGRTLRQPWYVEGSRHSMVRLDLDRVMIEYDKQGRIASCLTRSHFGEAVVGSTSTQYITIFTGPEVSRTLEDRIRNSDFQNTLIREIPPQPASVSGLQ